MTGTVIVLIGAGPVDRDGNITSVEWAFTRYAAGNGHSHRVGDPGHDRLPRLGERDEVRARAPRDHRRPMLAVTGPNVVAVGGVGAAPVCAGFVLVRAARRRA
ncbi:hypothetical protein [Dactylosporangium sp. CA-233914]|uniref:hypothetical protein n=1 Tax=Dactylosporangium sp. CA-233914 TaxID=3239934 RepID=UPI003D90B4CE